jgi:hypothetical protein
VIAIFAVPEKFVSSTWNAALGAVTDSIGCQYSVSASGVLTLQVVENADGSVAGEASTTAHINIVTTYTPPFDTCTALPFDVMGSGPLGGSEAQLSARLANASGSFQLVFSGARNGTTITGSASVDETLHDGGGNPYPTQGMTGNFSSTKQ